MLSFMAQVPCYACAALIGADIELLKANHVNLPAAKIDLSIVF